jgi:cytoskeleton protein RodZ
MSDQILDQPTDSSMVTPPTAGALLRKARESAGLHVAALAVSMKVPVKKLEALEADRLDLLPDAVFVRALASSVCRTLKIDPVPVLDLLPQTLTPRLGVLERGINTPFHASGEARHHTLRDFLRKPVVLLVGALLVGALALVFLPQPIEPESVADASPDSVVPAEQLLLRQPMPAPGDRVDATPSPLPGASALPPRVQAVSAPSEPVLANVPSTAPSANAATVPAPKVLATEAASANGLVLRSRGEAWVEVTDANGVVRIRKTLAAGETAAVAGPMPLSVVVGRADATEVEVRGKAFSLEKIAKDNVARFEVK